MTPRIKICCIRDTDEAWTAIRHGASALGLVSAMPSGPGPISEPSIARIAGRVPPGVTSVLLTASQDAGAIVAQQQRCRVNAIQLVDAVTAATHRELRARLPGIGLIQVIHVADAGAIDEAAALAPGVDALLLDSGNPKLTVKELGGTGRVHDWSISRRIVEAVACPVFLAGGLTPDNVGEAIARVGPYGLDLCSGVRTDGRLDTTKLRAFMDAVAGADFRSGVAGNPRSAP